MKVLTGLLLFIGAAPLSAFVATSKIHKVSLRSIRRNGVHNLHLQYESQNDEKKSSSKSVLYEKIDKYDPLPTATVLSAVCMLTSSTANAAGPDWGAFEGKTGSLLHPVAMIGMLALSVSTAVLGFDYRRQRTIASEINALKKSLPNLNGSKTVLEAISVAQSEGESIDALRLNKLKAALPVESQINDLQDERKQLVAKGPRDKHYSQGAVLAFVGTVFALEGPLNTYARAGKLFPGPHLYCGAALVCLWSLAVFMVPSMQKGNDLARSIHIGANIGGIGIFLWQLQSGIPILLKVWQLTSWP